INPGGYVVLENVPGETITISGTYGMECCCDAIRVYDGVGTGSLITSFNCSGTYNFTSAPGQTITVGFTSDGSVTGFGFAFEVTSSCYEEPTPGVSTPPTLSDNEIYDYHSASSAARGIQLEGVTDAWTISGNRFYQSAERSNTGGSHWAIDVGTTAAGAGGHTISGNHIGGSAADGSGVYTLTGSASFSGIHVQQATSGSLESTITGNVISGISHTGASVGGYSYSSSTPVFTGIWAHSGAFSITGNTIGS